MIVIQELKHLQRFMNLKEEMEQERFNYRLTPADTMEEREERYHEALVDIHMKYFGSKRKSSLPCTFASGISKSDFEKLAHYAAKKCKRISIISIDDAMIAGTVTSNSGRSAASFLLDFNDYGKVTGECWLSTSNPESSIPQKYAATMKYYIISYEATKKLPWEAPKPASPNYCTFCGAMLLNKDSEFCQHCGRRIRN